MLYFRRDPAMILALLVGLLQVASAFAFHWSDHQQGVLNGALTVIAGAVTAGMVSLDRAVPLVGGVVSAVISVGTAWGFVMDPRAQSAVMALVAAVVAAFVRTQVTVSTPPVELPAPPVAAPVVSA